MTVHKPCVCRYWPHQYPAGRCAPVWEPEGPPFDLEAAGVDHCAARDLSSGGGPHDETRRDTLDHADRPPPLDRAGAKPDPVKERRRAILPSCPGAPLHPCNTRRE
jgi:hypothetical protein